MTWAGEPYPISTSAMHMTASNASDPSTPVRYFFDFVGSPTGGSGGSDSSWQTSTPYVDYNLQPNHQYGYQVRARDSATKPNETNPSTTIYKYTLSSSPKAEPFSDITETSIRAVWSPNSNRIGTEYLCENVTNRTDSGWITITHWDSKGLTCGESYFYRVKSRNGDGVESVPTDLGIQSTEACLDPPVINPVGNASVVEGTAYTGPTPTLSDGTLPVSWSLVTPPSGMTIDSGTGVVTWPKPTANGSPHTITIKATNTAGSDVEDWQLTVNPMIGVLSVKPSDGLITSGAKGGPFIPLNKAYTLENTGGGSIDWVVSNTASWVSLSPSSGSLASGAAATISVSINSNADGLNPGGYDDQVSFANTTNGNGDTTRLVRLTVIAHTYTITATAGSHGTISPSGTITVSHGSDQAFTINPDPNYHIAEVLVDGSSVGAVSSYTFANVTANHKIETIFEIGNQPPTANAGSDATFEEGSTIMLDGNQSSDPDDGIKSFLWNQIGGSPVILSDVSAPMPTFVTPPVSESEIILTFKLTVQDNAGQTDSDEVSINIVDNGITGFPDDVTTFISSTGKTMGIKDDSGGNCVSIEPIDPSTITDSTNKPIDITYGLIDFQIKVNTNGGVSKITFYLDEPAPIDHKWYKYDSKKGWYDFSNFAVFNSTRDQITLTLVDGGDGDGDTIANGMIVDPSGLGLRSPGGINDPSSDGGGGGGGGCFITSASLNIY